MRQMSIRTIFWGLSSISSYLTRKKNHIDTIIGLPPNVFFGTGIPPHELDELLANKYVLTYTEVSSRIKETENPFASRLKDLPVMTLTSRDLLSFKCY